MSLIVLAADVAEETKNPVLPVVNEMFWGAVV